ncbi:MAG: subclass B3 metallo-beta-lactamase [Dokdonella sp.]|uniref:subclass B3 metallo-beta-lactamase n=1 Tax=Dokdonella sp. TaxID=2291710 RepID=UPI0032635B66
MLSLTFSLALLMATVVANQPHDQEPKHCPRCAQWNEHVEPYRLADNTWYVGTKGLASVLIVDPKGLVLIDGGLPQSAVLILANVRKAGFDPSRIRWILNSHAHFDHAGGIAALARITGAQVAAGREGVIALTAAAYHPDDPQAGFGEEARFPSMQHVRAVDDGDVITVGNTIITAVASPGHAPGGMSWRWTSCRADVCQAIVYLDSLNPVSTDDYRFTDHPDVVKALRATIDRLAALPCDVAMAAHPDQLPDAPNASTTRCAAYADKGRETLRVRLQQEHDRPAQ